MFRKLAIDNGIYIVGGTIPSIEAARRKLVKDAGLLRIRAGARLRNYHRCAKHFSAREYVRKILTGEIKDPTLSFQLKQGFQVIAVISDYLPDDAESFGKAAIIEWINPKVGADLQLSRKLFQEETDIIPKPIKKVCFNAEARYARKGVCINLPF
ncbi:MAG: hypothetical protein ACR2L1_10975 [Pyrinomonadaceae bacterium]